MKEKQKLRDEIDWVSTLVPLGFVGVLFAVFVLWPEQSRGSRNRDFGVFAVYRLFEIREN